VWNALAAVDAVRFTFHLEDGLRGCFVAQHHALRPQVVVMTRLPANRLMACTLPRPIGVALTASNATVLKAAFGIATIGDARCVPGGRRPALGIQDGVVQSPWKSQYSSLLTVPSPPAGLVLRRLASERRWWWLVQRQFRFIHYFCADKRRAVNYEQART
jgi:hypothetical protein